MKLNELLEQLQISNHMLSSLESYEINFLRQRIKELGINLDNTENELIRNLEPRVEKKNYTRIEIFTVEKDGIIYEIKKYGRKYTLKSSKDIRAVSLSKTAIEDFLGVNIKNLKETNVNH
ncbi:MAG: hypothetical protein ACRC1R_03480 [Cetobacterium sp.]|uniref:hypothetical protein n=1 Tax=Cetobacterium sp. TaxID=2071632 RepID=UPI003F312D21